MQNTISGSKRKSLVLTSQEVSGLEKFVKKFNTATEAAEQIGITPQTLDRIRWKKSGSPDNITLIRQKLVA